jgi:hypothetical protein
LKTIPAPDRNNPVIGPALLRFEQTLPGAAKSAKPPPAGQGKSEPSRRGADHPLVGAIRWDGWFKDNPWEKNLRSPEWRYRLPFFAEIGVAGEVRVCGDSQAVMDREIEYAKAGGLSYWAFCYYHPKSFARVELYNYGWKRYLASERKQNLHFCLLLQGGTHLGPTNEWDATVGQFVNLFKEPSYQRVCGDRPLLYVYSCDKLVPHFGSPKAAAYAFQRLRAASEKGGAGNPYIVAQIWAHLAKAEFLDAIRFDALGAYSAHGGTNAGAPYAKLIGMNRWYWNQYKATGREVVPLVNAGWDGRPRKYEGAWYETATPAELANAVQAAIAWNRANPNTARAETVLIYAWNEHDEGGWLCPTLNPDGTINAERLQALAAVLKPQPR